MDRDLSSRQRWSPWLRAGRKVALAAGVLAALGWSGQRYLRPSIELADVRVAVVERGPLEATIAATGTIVPRSEQIIASPVSAAVRSVRVSLGAAVSRGQILMELDTTASALALSNLEEQLSLKRAERRSADLQRVDVVRQTRSRRDLLRIDLESREAALSRLQKLGTTGAVSASNLLEAELNLKRVQVEIAQVDKKIVSLEARREADLERLGLELSILDKQRADQARRVATSAVTAPMDGIITDLVRDEGSVVAEGQALATIAATDAFRVEAGVSDFYGSTLAPQQRVRIRSSTSEFAGYVARILPTADSGRLALFIELDDPTAPALHINLRVDAEIITAVKPDVLKLRRGPALERAGVTELFVIEQGSAVRTRVRLGMSGRQVIEIMEGLEAGDQVIVSDTSAYAGLAEIRVR
ncbi:MAG TPA: HlyD family efflux transporter periplasmic adaptor subunit [Povalibacter sp.]|uniref:efflux RND transporter periplasmic adaptor subunit n=1 Tax=Povalibacter sp. TaxID=1962978 RepID=UPI002C96212C|nr:biotin/lipoyl-binding protein [Povalibacter sp.]HMN47278.1 HlyD family efflux transporter periplasmic adaptor subunit [Povalibacter sp.]